MARSNLSRHEELRYEYLLSNLEYLSAREKQNLTIFTIKNKLVISAIHHALSRRLPIMTITTMIIMTMLMIIKWLIMMTITGHRKGFPNTQKKKRQLKRSFRRTSEQQAESLPTYQDNYENYDEVFYQEPEPVTPKKAKKPKKKRRKIRIKRLLKLLGFLVILVIAGMIYMFFKGVNDVSSGETNYTAAVTETFNGEDSDDGTNILILGSDQRITQGSSDARTDTIMVMNIGNSDGKLN